MKRLVVAAAVLVSALVGVAVVASPASAVTAPSCPGWVVRSITAGPGWDPSPAPGAGPTDPYTMVLTKPVGGGTEASTHDINVDATSIEVRYTLNDGASTAAGAVRLFYYHSDAVNTLTDAPDGWAIAEDGDGGNLAILGNVGHIGTLGVVYDASNPAGGSVTFSGLLVGGVPVAFTGAPCAATPTPTTAAPVVPPAQPTTPAAHPTTKKPAAVQAPVAQVPAVTPEPSVSPSLEDTVSPSPSAAESVTGTASAADTPLAATVPTGGGSNAAWYWIGGSLVLGGAAALAGLVRRNRRPKFPKDYANTAVLPRHVDDGPKP